MVFQNTAACSIHWRKGVRAAARLETSRMNMIMEAPSIPLEIAMQGGASSEH